MVLEAAMNQVLRKLSVAGREGGKIILTLDDDKIWASNSGANSEDRFGLKYTQHVKDNRKGLVAHTAVSATTSIPLGKRSIESIVSLYRFLISNN